MDKKVQLGAELIVKHVLNVGKWNSHQKQVKLNYYYKEMKR